eukprot:12518248-Prorocentrum_lima.AAC.1
MVLLALRLSSSSPGSGRRCGESQAVGPQILLWLVGRLGSVLASGADGVEDFEIILFLPFGSACGNWA